MFIYREYNRLNSGEMDLIVNRCMETVLETAPEFKGDPDLVLQAFPNFTFKQMKEMLESHLDDPNRRILVVEDDNKNIQGHFIFSIKKDNKGIRYGATYTIYIHSEHRRKGLAQKLLNMGEKWWKEKRAEYAFSSTHVTNIKTQKFYLKNGYIMSKNTTCDVLQMYDLKKDL